jgi:hypothetical protein
VAAGLSLSGGNGFVTEAGDSADTGESDIKYAPSAVRNLQTLLVINRAEAIGYVCFSTVDITPLNEEFKPRSGQEEDPM